MKNRTVPLSLISVAVMAALLLTVSQSHAKKTAVSDPQKMEHHHDHAMPQQASGKTPQQKDAIGLFKKANALCDGGQFEESLPVYTKAIKLYPEFAEAYFKRALALYRLGSNLNALEDLTKAIEIKPDYMEAYFKRGVVWYSTGDEEKMIEDLKAAARLDSVDHTTHDHIMK